MKPRTRAIASSMAKHIGTLFGIAVMIVVAAEGMNAIYCLVASEREA